MEIFPYEVSNEKELFGIFERIGADPRCFAIFNSKRAISPLLVRGLDSRAANALKQELLSRGGDVIVHKNCIDMGIPETDALILATPKTLALVLDKLEQMPYWGLHELRAKLQAVIFRTSRKHWTLSLKGERELVLGEDPVLMGILNLTEDSFYPESRIGGELSALEKAREMVLQGASILDLGAESTRPGAIPLSAKEELTRLIPAISMISSELPQAIISVDTYKSDVAKEAILAGAHIINDIYGLGFDPRVGKVAAETGAALVINHIRGTPLDMQEDPQYRDTVAEILEHLQERIDQALSMGVQGSGIIIDPGIGFGKRLEDNLSILGHLGSFRSLGYPVMLGYSRKSFIGRICDRPDPKERLEGTLALTAFSTMKGVQILRVHDVKENRSVISMIKAVKEVLR